tara:strand:+ start:1302 stop:1763 length:462 start_codon:yes stop_codon:yes gene_type:complete
MNKWVAISGGTCIFVGNIAFIIGLIGWIYRVNDDDPNAWVMISGCGCFFVGMILLIVGFIGKNKVSQDQVVILQNPEGLQRFGINMPVQRPQIGTQQPNSTAPVGRPPVAVPAGRPPVISTVRGQSTGSQPPIPAEGLPPGWDMQPIKSDRND